MAMHLYRLLLLLLPGWFREEFAAEMSLIFRDTLDDARRGGVTALVRLWSQTIGDVAALAIRLHLDATRQDVTYALRTLRRTPTFSLAMVATLAIGLGPTLVIANLVEQVVLKPLPFTNPERLVAVWNAQPEKNRHEFPLSLADFVDLRSGQQAFEALATHAGTSVAFIAAQEPRQVPGVLTTADLFQVLKVTPVLGRPLTEADSAPGATAVMVLGADFWHSEFGGRRDVIGQIVRIDGVPTEIVGVLPPLDYPNGSRNFWLPLTIDPANFNRGSHYLNATGRLAEGVSIEQANDALNAIAGHLAQQFPSTNGGNGIEVIGLKQQLNGDSPRIITVLAVAIAAVLLIACTNVASLLSVRSSLRQSELALRTAIGASLRRLRRQLLMEHLLVAAAAALVGVAIALPLHRLLVEQRLLALPRATPVTMAWPAFAVLAVTVVLVGITLARISARRPAITTAASVLLRTSRHTSTRAQLRLRRALVVVEVAGALALVIVAGLMMRSAARLSAVDPGFRTQNIVTFGVVLPASEYNEPARRIQFVDRVLEQLRAIPGVRAAAAAGYAPMGPMRATRRFAPADRPLPPPGAEPLALDMPVGHGYFEVMGIPLVDGRAFDTRDTASSRPVLIVSDMFAREQFPGESAVGKIIGFYSSRPGGTPPPSREIVGVVRDVRQDGVRTHPMAQMYTPYPQSSWGFTSFFVRADDEVSSVISQLQRAVSNVDPMRPVRDVKTTNEIVRASLGRERAMTWMLAALATIALLLATIGLYGVSATVASARSRELAIRAAVGARPAALLRLVLGQGLATSLMGVLGGALVGLVTTRGLGALLYETPPWDPVTFAGTAALLLGIASVATYLPARRALRANPSEVLHAE
jgi:putative ABC transport system permease protein